MKRRFDRGSRLRWWLGVCGLGLGLVGGCSSDGSPSTCEKFCLAFTGGEQCASVGPRCAQECSRISKRCAPLADQLLTCLEGLSYSCGSSGTATASGDGNGPEALDSSLGTLFVSDSTCASLVREFNQCGSANNGGSSAGGTGGSGVGGTPDGGTTGGIGGGPDGGTGGFSGAGSGGSATGGSGAGGSSGGLPDLSDITFSVHVSAFPVDPNGEGGPAVPYTVRVCIDPAQDDFIRVENTGSASAGPFRVSLLLVKDYPTSNTVVEACPKFSFNGELYPGSHAAWGGATCCDFADTFSTFDINTRRIAVYADYYDDVSEVNESNNSATTSPLDL